MAEKFLVRIDSTSTASESSGINLETLRCLDRVVITAQPKSDDALGFIEREFPTLNITVDARQLDDVESVLSLLNAGAVRIIVRVNVLKSVLETGSVEDLSRLCVPLDKEVGSELRDALQARATTTGSPAVLIEANAVSDCHSRAENILGSKPSAVLAELSAWSTETYSKLAKQDVVPIIHAACFTTGHNSNEREPIASLFLSAITTDRPDGLYPTIVVNEHDQCLGLVYSSPESVKAAIATRRGVYQSRKRSGLWIKGETSGDVQELLKIGIDCDADTLIFKVRQQGNGFCHLKTDTCFGGYSGLFKLEKTIKARASDAPPQSYTKRLFTEPKLLEAKILEEASELGQAKTKQEVAFEAADLLYFALTKCIASGVDLSAVERNLDLKSLKVSRRKGNAKPEWSAKVGESKAGEGETTDKSEAAKEASATPKAADDDAGLQNGEIRMKSYDVSQTDPTELSSVLQRPSQKSSDEIMKIVRGIIDDVRTGGDQAVLKYTHRFEKAHSLTTPVIRAPYPPHLMAVDEKTKAAIDTSFANIHTFHASQVVKPMQVETMGGVICSRFSRPIERVGLYVPGGTAVLPSTAMMLGVPAMVAGCRNIVLASPPRADGTVTPEIVYIAHKVKAEAIVLAGGAQAVAAMAYGTESITKVDKILGPGNQFVTAAKMLVSNDTNARVAIDMPAGPSEVLVIADKTSNPAFVAADLLSQAEHGPDSQVILIAVDLSDAQLRAIEKQLHDQAHALPRVDIVRGAIDHSVTLRVRDIYEAMRFSNEYAPEHLILQVDQPDAAVELVENAGSVFIGMWTPESVGDYSAGVNHSLPTYGYAKQYSGVNLGSFTKHITSSKLTPQGLQNVGGAVVQLAGVEGLDAHARAVSIRLVEIEREAASGGQA